MPSDGNGIKALANSAVGVVLEPLTSVTGGAGLTLLALGLGSVVLTYPALSATQATLVAVGGWLTARTVTAAAESPARSDGPSFGTCIDCGRTVRTDADGPVRCVDCADYVATAPGTAGSRPRPETASGNPAAGGTTADVSPDDASPADVSSADVSPDDVSSADVSPGVDSADDGASDHSSPDVDSADDGASDHSSPDVDSAGNGSPDDGAAGPPADRVADEAAVDERNADEAAVPRCDRCGATDVPLERVRLLNSQDYDYCPDCVADAEASDVVHAVAMTPEEAHDVLGVPPDADEAAVRAAFRERIKAVHPDLDGDRDEFNRVRAAYERLSE